MRSINSEYLSLCGITLTAFVALLDYTLVNTALPTIQSTFQVSVLDLQWVFNIYCIVIAVFMVISGRLGDRYGRRLMFYWGTIILGLGSYGAGHADSFITLVIFRGIQSIGAATTITLAISLINHLFIGRAHYPMSFYAAITGLGLTLGPFLGGVIVMHLGWRWIFYINIPFLLVAFAICIPCLSESKTHKSSYIDYPGAILLTTTLSSLIYGIIRGEDVSFFDPQCIICIILFMISLPILIWVENRQVNPMINPRFFSNAKFLSATSVCIMYGGRQKLDR